MIELEIDQSEIELLLKDVRCANWLDNYANQIKQWIDWVENETVTALLR